MSQTHIAYVANVDSKHIERANGQSFDLWQVHDNLGNIWVVKKNVADLARTLVGQQVTFITRQEQKGNFLNFYADQILPLQTQGGVAYSHPMDQPAGVTQAQAQAMNQGWNPYEQPQIPSPQLSQMPLQGAVGPPSNGQEAAQAVYGSASHEAERSASINRAVAVKAAAEICKGDLYTFFSTLPDIVQFLEDGTLPAKIVEALFANAGMEPERVPNASAEGASMPRPDPPYENVDPDGVPF